MKRSLLLAAVFAAAFLSAGLSGEQMLGRYVDCRALLLVMLYVFILVLGRFSPGKCTHRLIVLNDPVRHRPLEVGKAIGFIGFAGTRLLFAGLIFTLAEIARVLAEGGDIWSLSAALTTTLNSALYAFLLYIVIHRSSAAAAHCAEEAIL